MNQHKNESQLFVTVVVACYYIRFGYTYENENIII